MDMLLVKGDLGEPSHQIVSAFVTIMILMKKAGLCLFLAALLLPVMPLRAQEAWYGVGVLATDVSRDETLLTVDLTANVELDRPLLIVSRDGSYREIVKPRNVYGRHILLWHRMKQEFTSGSQLYQ